MNMFTPAHLDNLYSNAFTLGTLINATSTLYFPKSYEFEMDLFDNDPITAEEESDLLISYLDIKNRNVTKLPKGGTAKDLLTLLKD